MAHRLRRALLYKVEPLLHRGHDQDVLNKEVVQKILNIPKVVFANVGMRLVVIPEPDAQSSIATLVDEFRSLTGLHAVQGIVCTMTKLN